MQEEGLEFWRCDPYLHFTSGGHQEKLDAPSQSKPLKRPNRSKSECFPTPLSFDKDQCWGKLWSRGTRRRYRLARFPRSIFVKDSLEFFGVLRFSQRDSQKDPRLLRIEGIRDDEIALVVVDLVVSGDNSVSHTGAPNNENPF